MLKAELLLVSLYQNNYIEHVWELKMHWNGQVEAY